jgi:hypothetical protein
VQTNAVRLELFGNSDIDHVKLRMDSESWDQPLAGETTAHPAVIEVNAFPECLPVQLHLWRCVDTSVMETSHQIGRRQGNSLVGIVIALSLTASSSPTQPRFHPENSKLSRHQSLVFRHNMQKTQQSCMSKSSASLVVSAWKKHSATVYPTKNELLCSESFAKNQKRSLARSRSLPKVAFWNFFSCCQKDPFHRPPKEASRVA